MTTSVTTAYSALLNQGYVHAPVLDHDEAEAWRDAMRDAARADRLTFRSLANEHGVVAWLPNHDMVRPPLSGGEA